MDGIKKILIISTDDNLLSILHFCFEGWGYEVFLWKSYTNDIEEIKKISPDIIVIDIHTARPQDLKICISLKSDPIAAFIPVITLIDKRQLRMHLLNLKYGVDDYLIKPPDPLDLRVRIEMALRRSQYSFYASPLTGIPGGRIIEETLIEKFKSKLPFAFGYIDIDNFKVFNDEYGYVQGDRIIMQTAYLIYNTVRQFGNPDDFTGHIGGDDFVFITTPQKYETICRKIIANFDKICPFHYRIEDRERGFVIAKDRTNIIRKIPLMSLSIAVINKNENSSIKTIIEINERVKEIKKYLKAITGSKFMADRRDQRLKDAYNPSVNDKEDLPHAYKPIGQILIDKKMISKEQLDEALCIHWRRGIILGEILKQLGFIKEPELAQALIQQSSLLTSSDALRPQ